MNLEDINERFKSGNSIPVERAHLKAEEWLVIYRLLKQLAYPDMTRISSPIGPLHHAGIAFEAQSVAHLVREQVGLPETVSGEHRE